MDNHPKLPKMPIIYYEEAGEGEQQNLIPYIEVEKEEPFPQVLFISEYRHTNEFEPDAEGNPQPIVDMILHMFVDFDILKEKLDPETFDKARVALGMKPLAEAQKAGAEILNKVNKNVEEKTGKVLN